MTDKNNAYISPRSSNETSIRSIIIVGGGTAGWLSAARLAKDHCADKKDGIKIRVIESPDVKTVGVGEGTWPTLRATLRELGISEFDFIRSCDASFKQGSKFIAWQNANNDHYHHPFTPPEGFPKNNLLGAWQKAHTDQAFAYCASPQAKLIDAGRAPKQIQTPEYAAVVNYSYHLDAGKFANFLRKHCCENLGVQYINDHVDHVNLDNDGYIKSLNCRENGEKTADLFIDCSGASGLLIEKTLGSTIKRCDNILFNNRALAVHVPYLDEQQEIESCTISHAQQNGWIWDIGLPSRRGVGHVYSSDYHSADKAWQDLQNYLASSLPAHSITSLEPRELKFTPGYRETPWLKNCVAIGMASGFIEPLEASAIAMIELASKTISKELPHNREHMDIISKRYNQRFSERWERVINFLKLHYVLSRREDSDYWIDNRHSDSIPESLKELLQIWKYQVPSTSEFYHIEDLFGPPSYQYILYGMNYFPLASTHSTVWDCQNTSHRIFASIDEKIQRGLANLPNNRNLLNAIRDKKH
ncbi:MAG: tryptophan halogenase [Flavobacteriales bacterium]|jgi:tryptophan halogenase